MYICPPYAKIMAPSRHSGFILGLIQIILYHTQLQIFSRTILVVLVNLEKFYGIGPYKFLERGNFLYMCEKEPLKFQLICHAYNMKQQ